uniref:Uncharacterized protein n=1 Tax=Musa acuminata TaxID=4641 RepID=Q1EP79_MUSAC|nr:hypothetical protein MA4_54B05.18 [Musa acuminata]
MASEDSFLGYFDSSWKRPLMPDSSCFGEVAKGRSAEADSRRKQKSTELNEVVSNGEELNETTSCEEELTVSSQVPRSNIDLHVAEHILHGHVRPPCLCSFCCMLMATQIAYIMFLPEAPSETYHGKGIMEREAAHVRN